MGAKLYPPYIDGTLPAFWLDYDPSNVGVIGGSITIPFTDNPARIATISGYSLRLRTASSGSYLFSPIIAHTANIEEKTVTFTLTAAQAKKLKEGQYYKAQIAYCGDNDDDIGYYSTVGVIKCTSKPKLSISNLVLENINLFTNEFIGLYDVSECKDQSEKVYTYRFKMFNENGDLYYDSGELLHNSSYDTEYGYSIDRILINQFVADDTMLSIQYSVTTLNGLELSTGLYKLTNEGFAAFNRDIKIIPESNLDNGYITVKLKGELDNDRSYYYVINEDLLESERDENNKYLKDFHQKTAIERIYDGVKATNSPLNLMKKYDLYRYYNKGFSQKYLYYLIDKNQTFENTILINDVEYKYNGELEYKPTYYYVAGYDEEDKPIKSDKAFLESQLINTGYTIYKDEDNNPVQGEDMLVSPVYHLIDTCRNLTKSLTYTYVDENNYYINEKGKLQSGNQEYYIIDKEDYEAFYYGAYLLSRASNADNYSTWVNIARFRLEEEPPSAWSFKDFTIEHGRKYIYSLQQYNIWGLYSKRIVSEPYLAGFEDAFLYDGKRALKIRFNPEVSSFKTTILEQKTDTIGGRFPYITRNGETYYKEFPLGGLIAQEMDDEELFITRNAGTSHRHSNPAIAANEPENALRDYHDFSDENIMLERQFKLEVLAWLNDGRPKLFKSPYEGNYIVRLMNVSLSPIKELGRMLHTFTSQAYEIAECTYENLLRFGFINTSQPTDTVGLWKTYNLADEPAGSEIYIRFDDGLMSFSIQDMMPGDIFYVEYEDGLPIEEPFMIGITGAYICSGINRKIKAIRIPPRKNANYMGDKIENKITGVINCYYQGVRITAFDAVIGMQLKTIPSQQFIGVDPALEYMRTVNWSEQTNIGAFVRGLSQSEFRNFQGYTIRDYLDKIIVRKENSQDGSELYYIDTEGMKYIASFDPGNVIDRINATLNLGEADKIKMLKLEQGHFRLRELVPVYVMNPNANFKQPDQGKKKVEQKSSWYVSVTPFGYPHPIEELTTFEMIDPFCVFEVFSMQDGQWKPVKGPRGDSPYYDPYYQDWLYDYQPYFQMNYSIKKISYIQSTDQNIKPYKRSELTLITDDITGEQTYNYNGLLIPEERIYDIEIQKGKDEENNDIYYYINAANEIIYLDGYNYYEDGSSFPKATLKKVPDPDIVYYIKEYDNKVDLSVVKEKIYKNFENINSIRIGTGVMAELTFQIKVVDYYTEINPENQDVITAKQEYLELADFYRNLMKNYSIIENAVNTSKKYKALAALYERLVKGKQTDMQPEDINTIELLLSHPADKKDLNLLSIYDSLYIATDLGVIQHDLFLDYLKNTQFSIEYNLKDEIKNKSEINQAKDILNNLFIFNDMYYNYEMLDLNNEILDVPIIGIDEEVREPVRVVKSNLSDYMYYKYTEIATGNAQRYFVNIYELDEYYLKHTNLIRNQLAVKPDGTIIPNKSKIEGYAIEVLSLSDYDKLYNEIQQVYTQEKYEEALVDDECLWIQRVSTNSTSLHEESEIIKVLTPGSTTEGAENKLNIINDEIEEFQNKSDELNLTVSTVDSEYKEKYNNLMEAIRAYNKRIYYLWGLKEISTFLRNEASDSQSLKAIYYYLNNINSALGNYANTVDRIIDTIVDAVTGETGIAFQIADPDYGLIKEIHIYNKLKEDRENDDELDAYHEERISLARGKYLAGALTLYFCALQIINTIYEHLGHLVNDLPKLEEMINKYKTVGTLFSDLFYGEVFAEGNTQTILESYQKGFSLYYEQLISELNTLNNTMRSNWISNQVVNTEEYIEFETLYWEYAFVRYFLLNALPANYISGQMLQLGKDINTGKNRHIALLQNEDVIVNNSNLQFNDYLQTNFDQIAYYSHGKGDPVPISQLPNINGITNWRTQRIGELNPLYNSPTSSVDPNMIYMAQIPSTTQSALLQQLQLLPQYAYSFTVVTVETDLKGDGDTTFIYFPISEAYYKNVEPPIEEVNLEDGYEKDENGYIYYYQETSGEYIQTTDFSLPNVKYYLKKPLENYNYFLSLEEKQQQTILNISTDANTMLGQILNVIIDLNDTVQTNDYIISHYLSLHEHNTPNTTDIDFAKRVLNENITDITLEKLAQNVNVALEEYLALIRVYRTYLIEHYDPSANLPYSLNNLEELYNPDKDNPDSNQFLIHYCNEETYNYYYTDQGSFIVDPNSILQNNPNMLLNTLALDWYTNLANSNDDSELKDYGLEYWYKETMAKGEVNQFDTLLQQALALKEIYEQQYSAYLEKYEKYQLEANENTDIYNNYANTPELDYFNDHDENSIDKIREQVREAWWKFLNLLDEKYTAEKARGRYL